MPAAILILASDPAVREPLRWVAEEFGSVATTGKPAMAIYLAAVHEPRVAIVDLDVVPPGGRSGLLSTLRERFGISLVGTGSPDALAEADQLGLAASLPKPLIAANLLSILDRLLSEHPKRSNKK